MQLLHGDLVKQLLDPTEGTQKSADPSAENDAKKNKNSQHIVWRGILGGGEGILQSAERAACHRTGTGVAVKTGCTNVFGYSLKNVTGNIAL
jgi:hypothetical protein